MIRIILLAALGTCIYGASIVDKNERIISGIKAEDGQFPYQVSLTYNSNHGCSGSILNNNWILTTARCTYPTTIEELTILVGTNQLNGTDGKFYNVEKIIIHEEYHIETNYCDIALVKVSEPIIFGEKVQPVGLSDVDVGKNVNCTISGWGSKVSWEDHQNDLFYFNTITLGNEGCGNLLENVIYDNELCTVTDPGAGICHGDGGGPVLSNGKQVGIVSWTQRCAQGFPDVHVRVSSFLDWIQDTIEKN